MITIKQLKKETGLLNEDIGNLFGLSKISFANSSAKKRYENALCEFYEIIKNPKKKQDEESK